MAGGEFQRGDMGTPLTGPHYDTFRTVLEDGKENIRSKRFIKQQETELTFNQNKQKRISTMESSL